MVLIDEAARLGIVLVLLVVVGVQEDTLPFSEALALSTELQVQKVKELLHTGVHLVTAVKHDHHRDVFIANASLVPEHLMLFEGGL